MLNMTWNFTPLPLVFSVTGGEAEGIETFHCHLAFKLAHKKGERYYEDIVNFIRHKLLFLRSICAPLAVAKGEVIHSCDKDSVMVDDSHSAAGIQ